jgi:ATP/ADP translocase
MYSSKYILTCSLFEIYILQNLYNLIIKDLILTIIIIIFLMIQIICGFYFCEIKILIHPSQLIYKLLTYQHINYPRGPSGAVRRALVAYEVWGSTPLFVCSRSLGEPLPPGAGISLGEAWDTLVHTKKKISTHKLFKCVFY